ncbi:MAG: hypothetical protein ACO3DQ_08265, partial [Cephaloticoccus sp.]
MKRLSRCVLAAVGLLLLFAAGCQIAPRDPLRPGRTKLSAPLVVLPMERLGNYVVVGAKWDRHGPYHFLGDTGSPVLHVSPDLAER